MMRDYEKVNAFWNQRLKLNFKQGGLEWAKHSFKLSYDLRRIYKRLVRQSQQWLLAQVKI